MKKGSIITVVAVVVVAALAVGGYAAFHKTSKPAKPVSAANSSAPAVNNDVLVTKTSSSLGQYLAEPNGQPLYTFNGDTSGVSNCTGACLADWPVYQAKGATTNLPAGVGTIKRTDNGQTQYTYNGMPLYTFTGDTNGTATGNGIEDFAIAKPAAAAAAPSSGSSTSSSSPAPAPAASSNSSSSSYGSDW